MSTIRSRIASIFKCFVCCLSGARGEPGQKDDIVHIHNVVLGHKSLETSQHEQLAQQVSTGSFVFIARHCFRVFIIEMIVWLSELNVVNLDVLISYFMSIFVTLIETLKAVTLPPFSAVFSCAKQFYVVIIAYGKKIVLCIFHVSQLEADVQI